MNKIVDRIEREVGVSGLVSLLAGQLTPTDLQSLLLEVYRLRSERQRPVDVLSNYASNRFVQPSLVSPRRLLTWDQIAFEALPSEFQLLDLSPVCPLGTSSILGSVDQNWSVTTSRNTEVVSDATNVLALECALRRRILLRENPKSTETVHLAASHRLLRAQRHSRRFELSTLGLHIRFYLQALRVFLSANVPLHLSVSDFHSTPRYPRLEKELLEPIQSEFTEVNGTLDEERTRGKGYYLDLCFHIHATNSSGQRLELVDGGIVDWTQRLLSNAKERLVISGIGSERLCSAF